MNDTTVKYQNKMLNCEKALACMLVIILHCEFPTIIGSTINIVARVGVPLFFMVSGFFSISLDPDKTKKSTSYVETGYRILRLEYLFRCDCEMLAIPPRNYFANDIYIDNSTKYKRFNYLE